MTPTPLFSFLAGFLCAAAIFGTVALTFYASALRRVRSIQASIRQYHEANKLVGEAVNQTFDHPTKPIKADQGRCRCEG